MLVVLVVVFGWDINVWERTFCVKGAVLNCAVLAIDEAFLLVVDVEFWVMLLYISICLNVAYQYYWKLYLVLGDSPPSVLTR